MASTTVPEGGDTDRGNNPTEPADPAKIAAAVGEPVHEAGDFPGGGGEGGTGTPGPPAGPPRGSTGRNATDAGKTDSEGVSGGGMAGSAGG